MSLKTQLVLVAVISLLLPFAGVTYVSETELALRANQQELLMSVAISMAATLETPGTLSQSTSEDAWYLPSLQRAPTLDGYSDDWTDDRPLTLVSTGDTRSRYNAAQFDQRVYLAVVTPSDATALTLLTRTDDDETLQFNIDLRQPGGQVVSAESSSVSVQAYVALTDRLRIEISMAANLVATGAGFRLLRSDKRLASSFSEAEPPPPIAMLATVQQQLSRFQQPGMRLRIVNKDRYVVADTGAGPLHLTTEESSTALSVVFRRILDATGPSTPLLPVVNGRDNNRIITDALSGQAGSRWVKPIASADAASVVAAVPLRFADTNAGALIVQQLSNARLLLSSQALSRLATLTLLATLGTAAALLAYAAWLSLRIRKLAKAADTAMSPRGELSTELPSQRAGDEIGSLSRSFSGLLRRVGQYNDYLQALSGRLSHELNTPLSIVSSSLENLSIETLDEDQRRYTERALQGVERMRKLVRAMTEATRVEQAASEATRQVFDLNLLLSNLVAAYEDNYAPQEFVLANPQEPVPVWGSATLLVQLLDKVIDNAVSYALPGTVITLNLAYSTSACKLSIANQGEVLPDHQLEQIFESLVSFRPDSSRSHLGFGLYIARLIAQAHGGRLSAKQLREPPGTAISLELPLTEGL